MKERAFVLYFTCVTIWWPAYLNRPGSLCSCDHYRGITGSVAVADVISFWLQTSAKQRRYLFSGPPDQVRFEFPYTLIGILTMTYLKGQSRRVIKSWYIGGGPEQRFRLCFAEGLIFDLKKNGLDTCYFFNFRALHIDTLWAFTWKIICHCLVKNCSVFITDPRMFGAY